MSWMHGTHIPLAFRPQLEDAPDCSGTKHAYSIITLIVCNNQATLHSPPKCQFLVWDRTQQRQQQLHLEFKHCSIGILCWTPIYFLGQSAFLRTRLINSASRRHPREQEIFNNAISKPPVVLEQTIGILQGRFSRLGQIRNVVANNPKDMKKILDSV